VKTTKQELACASYNLHTNKRYEYAEIEEEAAIVCVYVSKWSAMISLLIFFLSPFNDAYPRYKEEEEEEDEECTWELCISYGINLPDKMRAATPLVIETERFTYTSRPAVDRLGVWNPWNNKCFHPSRV
jgi:hypothetical protein